MANTAGKKTITLDDIEYKNVPNQQKIDELMKDLEANKHIVIIGAGITCCPGKFFLVIFWYI